MKHVFLISFVVFFSSVQFSFSALQSYTEDYARESVLATGKWFKFTVSDEGIYRLSYSALKQTGLTNPGNPRIFGNNFGQLSYYNNDPKPDDLKEIPVLLVTGPDGIFNEGDYLLFYVQSTHRWKYDYATGNYKYIRHNYSDTSYYFITSSPTPSKRVKDHVQPSLPAGYTSSTYDALYIHEIEAINLLRSGREWFQPVSTLSGVSIKPGFSGIITQDGIKYRLRVLARSPVHTLFRLFEGNNMQAGVLVPDVNMFSTTGTYARDITVSGTFTPSTLNPNFEIRYFNNGEQQSRGWLDYLELQGRAATVHSNKSLIFSDSRSIGHGKITEFNIKSTATTLNIWDVTDQFNPKIIQAEKSGEYFKFRCNTDSLKKFIAFTSDQVITPAIKALPVPNQNLHASPVADMVIVSHPVFLKYANKIAEIHFRNSGLISLVVTPEQIYNEFSGGIPDIVAIRNFLRMKFLKQSGTSHPLKYLLLFGDGSYDNKKQPPINPNFVPTYQSLNSTVVVSSFVSDDFYGLLEDGEGEAEGTEDIGIGRFPVFDTAQASVIVAKVSRYLDPANGGPWRNIISIAADDEDSNTHMNDAEGLSYLLETKYPTFNIEKIYLDAFRQITGVNGQSYPDVEQAINSRINSGCLIFNYIGHGNEIGLAHERVVKTQSINSWKNITRLPLFITATCEFSRFDDVELNPFTGELTPKNSAGEMVLLNPEGGGIGLMTTTRVVYSAPNYTINRFLLNYAFEKDSTGEALRLGDIIRLAKKSSGGGTNKRNFLLLGDPALRLAYPRFGKVVTDSINGIHASSFADTLKALSRVTVSGHIEDKNGNVMTGFNGQVFQIVFDKSTKIKTLANDGGQPMDFYLQNSTIFSGKTIAKEGRFSFSFIVPRDINYSFGNGKISYYASNGTVDMHGHYNRLIVGGFSNLTIADTTGPVIRLFLNDTLFRNGDTTDENPVIFAILSDDAGINTTGAGIGHDIIAWIDGDRNSAIILNSFYENVTGNYVKGTVRYPLENLSEGPHTLTLRAWDNYNNSSTATVKFIVKTHNGFFINNLINYPNPLTDHTFFSAGHNRPDANLTIKIEIFDMSGRKIRVIEENVPAAGYRFSPVFWDGTVEGGKKAGRGIYPYSVTISTERGESARATGRLIIL